MLQIRKKGNKNFFYYSGTFAPYTASDLTIIFNGNTGFLRSESGRVIFEVEGWSYTDIRVYDDTASGTEESFANVIDLTQRLIDLGCPAYYTDGDIVISNLISTDSGNALILGTDGLLYSSGGTSTVTTTNITDLNTTFNGTQKGLSNIYEFNNISAQTVTIDADDYTQDDIGIIQRGYLGGTLEILPATGQTLKGIRDIENRFFVNDPNSFVFFKKDVDDRILITGNLTRGYTGSVIIDSYSGDLIDNGTEQDIYVFGSGFSSNMIITITGNATQSTAFTFVDESEIILHLTPTGIVGDNITITYNNGDIFTDTDALSIVNSVIVYQDALNNSSVDTSIWNILTATNGVITETSTQLELSNTGVTNPNNYGLELLNSVSSANDLIIAQINMTLPNTQSYVPRFGITTSAIDLNDIAYFMRQVVSPYNQLRCVIIDGGSVEVNPNTGINSGVDIRIKYVPSTGAITFEYWNGSTWAELSSSAGNVDLGASVKVVLYNRQDVSDSNSVDFKDFFISDDDYSTRYPQ